MAQKVNIVLVDDLDGSEAVETVSFSLDGASYEIDLSEDHAAAMRDAFAAYVGTARKVTGRRPAAAGARKPAATTASGHSAREVRDWARENGRTVPDRGRIPADIREAFEAAH